MPSDEQATAAVAEHATLSERAYTALSSRVEAFRSAVATAEDEVRGDLLRSSGVQSFRGEQALIELGPFAAGRIDPDRFAMLLGTAEEELTPDSIDVLAEADAILAGFADHSVHRVTVEPGGDLRNVVKDSLAQLGRAFGAARAVELARSGAFDPTRHGHLLDPLPFRLWNRAERRLAPPLQVEVLGEDCLPAGLGEFLDGAVTILIVATGPTTPAPLARLVTPGTFVMQTARLEELKRVETTEHPAVVLLFDEDRPEQAHFVHDPEGGAAPWSRLSISRMPTATEVGRGHRAPAWVEELAHLRTLSEKPQQPAAVPGPSAPEPAPASAGTASSRAASDPADRLASWLIAHTDLSDL